jgi:hypothetical protein
MRNAGQKASLPGLLFLPVVRRRTVPGLPAGRLRAGKKNQGKKNRLKIRNPAGF